MPATAKRLAGFTESVIREMTRVAQACGAVNLAQGFPDFDPPEELVEAAARAMREGPHQYAVTWGAPEFRRALAEKQSRFTGLAVDPDTELVVTCGGTEAMMAAMLAVCDPGDRVVVFTPFYENYGADAILCGARPVFVRLHAPEFRFDPEELRAAMRGAKAVVVCNPSNPCGRVFTRAELEAIGELAAENGAWVLMDEVYEHIVYEPHRHVHMAALPGMWERTLTTGSLSKTYSITGWRLGYVMGPAGAIGAARKAHDFLTVGAAAPLQAAAVAALRFPDAYYAELRGAYARRRELFLGYLERTGLPFTRPEGAYYVLVDISRYGRATDTEFCRWLAREIGVAAVPGSSFFDVPEHRFMRLHFAKRDETLHEAGRRLLKLAEL